MPIFTNNTFRGHYPVGTAVVVSARNAEDAALILNGYLAAMGLAQEPPLAAADMQPFPIKAGVGVRVLCDGNY